VKARLLVGDCRVTMATLPDASMDAIVCDPPYELGFMGKAWDASGIAYDVEVWRQAFRVLKPGGHLLAFSGSRTYHRMACAIEDAGFEIRDQIMWVYGSGFPKSLDVSKAIDKAAGAVREVVGAKVYADGHVQRNRTPRNGSGRLNFTLRDGVDPNSVDTLPATDAARQWSGWGTALKPAHEPICMARKPLIGTVAANVLAHGTGAINVNACRVDTNGEVILPVFGGRKGPDNNGKYGNSGDYVSSVSPLGRWPANFIHDGSDEATAGLGEAARFFYTPKAGREDREEGCNGLEARTGAEAVGRVEGAAGTAHPRSGAGGGISTVRNHHPTVKPTDLMRYLCRLVTPPGGTVLDPFTGSGSTGRGAVLEGFDFIGCELSPEYAEIARARIRGVAMPLFPVEVE
jgi:site-specific DNA-methyltransferase (adenine-specific)